jgi:hypothetical protein
MLRNADRIAYTAASICMPASFFKEGYENEPIERWIFKKQCGSLFVVSAG